MNNTQQKSKVVAIDGPCGSGKSTIAKLLAKKLNTLYIDTGAMFRSLALSISYKNIPFEEGPLLEKFIKELDFQYGISDEELVIVNGENLTTKIRDHKISKLASKISQIPSIRKFLVDFQRELAQKQVCVMEGRDIGTIVFPNSFCKFFLTAATEERAKRRLHQLNENGDHSMSIEQVIKDVTQRDQIDMNREHAPLKQADDAILIDSTELEREAVLEKMKEYVITRSKENEFTL